MMVHRSGDLDCCGGTNGQAGHFGHGGWLAPMLTTDKDFEHRIVPQFQPQHGGHTWYFIDGKNAFSPFLEFDLTLKDSSGYCFNQETTYELWYGEDLLDQNESDNGGTAYTDIYICPEEAGKFYVAYQ